MEFLIAIFILLLAWPVNKLWKYIEKKFTERTKQIVGDELEKNNAKQLRQVRKRLVANDLFQYRSNTP